MNIHILHFPPNNLSYYPHFQKIELLSKERSLNVMCVHVWDKRNVYSHWIPIYRQCHVSCVMCMYLWDKCNVYSHWIHIYRQCHVSYLMCHVYVYMGQMQCV